MKLFILGSKSESEVHSRPRATVPHNVSLLANGLGAGQ